MEGNRERGDRSRQSGGGSIWSGLKQMFNNKPSQGPGPVDAGQKKLQHSAYSYSCLGNSSRRTDDDMYEGPAGSQALSRNISYSHESVFQMDPYVVQVRCLHTAINDNGDVTYVRMARSVTLVTCRRDAIQMDKGVTPCDM